MRALYCCIWILILSGYSAAGDTSTAISAITEPNRIAELRKRLDTIISTVVEKQPTLKNSKPGDKFLTNQMKAVEEIGEEAFALPQSDAVLDLRKKSFEVLDILQQRRVYCYMLWAERTLEESSSEEHQDLSKLSQDDRIRLYEILGEINLQLIPENMLTREIVSRLTEIYDTLDAEHKKAVRVRNIHRQADPLSKIKELQARKSFDDF